jgi:hypothetical protein
VLKVTPLAQVMLSTALCMHHAGWVLSHACRACPHQSWRELGYSSLEDFLIGFWEGFFMDRRAPPTQHCAPGHKAPNISLYRTSALRRSA